MFMLGGTLFESGVAMCLLPKDMSSQRLEPEAPVCKLGFQVQAGGSPSQVSEKLGCFLGAVSADLRV